jgi:hypothetical protein
MGDTIEYGITFPRLGIAEQPSPWKYLTNFAREAERMGCAYGVVGDRLEAGIDPFSVLTAITEAQPADLERQLGQPGGPAPCRAPGRWLAELRWSRTPVPGTVRRGR